MDEGTEHYTECNGSVRDNNPTILTVHNALYFTSRFTVYPQFLPTQEPTPQLTGHIWQSLYLCSVLFCGSAYTALFCEKKKRKCKSKKAVQARHSWSSTSRLDWLASIDWLVEVIKRAHFCFPPLLFPALTTADHWPAYFS
ncbi:hypothetical protein FRC18_010718 [Serendipita sp. 400]|nr:hypothetical protein FRC18_010718 [Serendipita sp. 400]